MTVCIQNGDVREKLKNLADESVHCVVTSPPYWGLRKYDVSPTIWGGSPDCAHEWGAILPPRPGPGNKPGDLSTSSLTNPERQNTLSRGTDAGAFCQLCGAWRGDVGLEPTPELYVEHIVEVFQEVRRALRSDGVCWINLGDCYATGAGKVGDHPGGGKQGAGWRGDRNGHEGLHGYSASARGTGAVTQPNRMPLPGLKPKDLVGVPWMVAFALRAGGWYLRADVVWSKLNPMPESVTDRPTKSHEYLFLLSKSARYFYDAEAIKEPASFDTHARRADNGRASADHPRKLDSISASPVPGASPHTGLHRARCRKLAKPNSGIKNNGSFDAAMAVMPAERNKRSVWTIATAPFPEAHFATFPAALVEPCIKAGCPVGGTCLDPFAGSGTVGLVADRLQRNAILIELSAGYVEMARRRIDADAPLFSKAAE